MHAVELGFRGRTAIAAAARSSQTAERGLNAMSIDAQNASAVQLRDVLVAGFVEGGGEWAAEPGVDCRDTLRSKKESAGRAGLLAKVVVEARAAAQLPQCCFHRNI